MDEDMGLFVGHYNKYIKKNGLKHSNKILIKFRKSKPCQRNGNTRRRKKGK